MSANISNYDWDWACSALGFDRTKPYTNASSLPCSDGKMHYAIISRTLKYEERVCTYWRRVVFP